MKTPVVLLLLAASAFAEVRMLTLRQALDVALQQNPDLVLARLDQQRARAQVTIARDLFQPKIYGGSGAAKTWGFPTSIDGSAPAIFQARTQMALFNRPQSYQVAQANEAARGAEIDVDAKQDEVAYRVTSLFLDAQQASRSLAAAQRQGESLARVLELVEARVSEGRALPIERSTANLAVLQSKRGVESLSTDLMNAETSLALVLGLSPDDRVRAVSEEPPALTLDPEDRTIEQALENSKELRRLESNLQAKTLEIKANQAERLPKINLVAQYSLLGRYNNYEQFFRAFQRHNAQLGASFEIPLLPGRASSAAASQAEVDVAKIRVQVNQARARITADLRRGYQEVRRANTARDVARADLDLARERVTLDLALMDEGRASLAQVEQSRAAEQEKWLAYYQAQHSAERARLDLLRQSGSLLASLR
jgi:outer membrane protein TolC